MTFTLVKEAVAAGARLESACKEIGIDPRTLQRWSAMACGEDQRRGPTTEPANALTKAEEDDIVTLLNAKEFAGLSPHQVVAKLADMNIYKASERTMYRILRRRKLLRHRHRSLWAGKTTSESPRRAIRGESVAARAAGASTGGGPRP